MAPKYLKSIQSCVFVLSSFSFRNLSDRLQLHGAIYRPDSFVLMLGYCANLKAIRYESTTLNRIVADKSHRVIVAITALTNFHSKTGYTF